MAPGRYEVPFTPVQEEVYIIRVDGSSNESEESVAEVAGWVLSYSPEYRNLPFNRLKAQPNELTQPAVQSGGRVSIGDPANAFENTLQLPVATRPIWHWLLALAAILLLFDIAVRRLAIVITDLQKFWTKLIARLRLVTVPTIATERSQHMSALLRTKERIQLPQLKKSPSTPAILSHPSRAQSKDKSRAQSTDKDKPKLKEKPPGDTATTASRLLAHKRERQDESK